ncbi:MAG: serine/threonine protein kinase [Polyangiaceae bacterium]|nr:serine/threonine protein kinase [Polyangiaceae bacterium]
MSNFDPTAKVTSKGTIIQVPLDEAPVKFAPGQVVAGIYRIDRHVGEGGMATVLGATHLPTGRVVALKFLQPDTRGEDGAVARFWREARAISHLNHPNVVRIFDVGTLADDTPFMAMELLDGQPLGTRMKNLGRMPLDVALEYTRQTCEALSAAHALGVIHRDLKPDNLFLTRGDQSGEVIKVLDFGISKTMRATVADDQQKLTKTTDVFGSPTYMSPEQLKASRDVDPRTDIWAIGVILHEMLAGTPPFDGRTVAEIFGAILYKPAEPLTRVRPDVPPAVEAAVLRALEKDRDKRFGSVSEFWGALAAAAQPLQQAPTTSRSPTQTAPVKAASKRSRMPVVIAAVLICVIAGVASFLLAKWFG